VARCAAPEDVRLDVDAHWLRGNSYPKIGWNWIRSAHNKGWELLTRLRLNGGPDPEPALVSHILLVRDQSPKFKVKVVNCAKMYFFQSSSFLWYNLS
jgi:hypothetical protein